VAERARKPLVLVPAFWDASALIPLCVRQSLTPRATALYKDYEVVVWWATPVEIAGAFARLLRMRQISGSESAVAAQIARTLADSWSVIQPSDSLLARAIQLVGRYDLRAADALQLAAALEWCENLPQSRALLTADQKLRAAALAAGFEAPPM